MALIVVGRTKEAQVRPPIKPVATGTVSTRQVWTAPLVAARRGMVASVHLRIFMAFAMGSMSVRVAVARKLPGSARIKAFMAVVVAVFHPAMAQWRVVLERCLSVQKHSTPP
jgi:hypothetical protein